MNPPKLIGKIIYILTWPAIRLLLIGTTRVYVIIRSNDEILVTKNWLGLHKKWRLPGGGLKRQEDPLNGLTREIKEELGLDINGLKLNLVTPKPFKNSAAYNYLIYTLNYPKKPILTVNNREVAEHKWLKAQDLSSYPCSEELTYAAQKLL